MAINTPESLDTRNARHIQSLEKRISEQEKKIEFIMNHQFEDIELSDEVYGNYYPYKLKDLESNK